MSVFFKISAHGGIALSNDSRYDRAILLLLAGQLFGDGRRMVRSSVDVEASCWACDMAKTFPELRSNVAFKKSVRNRLIPAVTFKQCI